MSPRKYRTALNPTGCIDGTNLFGTSFNCTVPLTRTSEPFKPLEFTGIIQGGSSLFGSSGESQSTVEQVAPTTTSIAVNTTSQNERRRSSSSASIHRRNISTRESPATSTEGTPSRGQLLLAEAASAVYSHSTMTPSAKVLALSTPPTVNKCVGESSNTQGMKRSKADLQVKSTSQQEGTKSGENTTHTNASSSSLSHVEVTDVFEKDASNGTNDQEPQSTSTSTTASPSTSSSMSPFMSIAGSCSISCTTNGSDATSANPDTTAFSLGNLSSVNPFSIKPTPAGSKSKRRGSSSHTSHTVQQVLSTSSPLNSIGSLHGGDLDTVSAPPFTIPANPFAAPNPFTVPANPFSVPTNSFTASISNTNESTTSSSSSIAFKTSENPFSSESAGSVVHPPTPPVSETSGIVSSDSIGT